MQTVAQIEGFMLTQRYDGLSGPEKKGKGRRGTFQQKTNKPAEVTGLYFET